MERNVLPNFSWWRCKWLELYLERWLSFLFIISFSSSWSHENSFSDSRALEMFVPIFPCTVNLIIRTSSSKLICRCRDWNLWQEVENYSGFNTVHSWIEINPEQLHLNIIVTSDLFYCSTFFLLFFSFIFITTYLSRIMELENTENGIKSGIKWWIFVTLIWTSVLFLKASLLWWQVFW